MAKHPPRDLSPESYLPTVEVDTISDSKETVEMGSLPTSDLQDTELIRTGVPYATLVRARGEARVGAFDECRRTCNTFYLSWRRGVITGAIVTISALGTGLSAAWAWVKWWPKIRELFK